MVAPLPRDFSVSQRRRVRHAVMPTAARRAPDRHNLADATGRFSHPSLHGFQLGADVIGDHRLFQPTAGAEAAADNDRGPFGDRDNAPAFILA